MAQQEAAPPPASQAETDNLETITVTVTPVMGTGLPLNSVPSNVQTLRAETIATDHAQTVTEVLDHYLSSVTLTDTEGSPFQEDIIERGFTASPVLGTPQGLAFYQNGVRINEPFGDTLLWDFVPVFAIDTLQELPGSNPVFGLNALGGAFTLQMKTGFDAPGSSVELAGGSFGRIRGIAKTGYDFGDSAIYVGALASHEDGWRDISPSDLVQGYADFAIRHQDYTLGVSLTLASSNLNGNAADPAEDDPTAAFAGPDSERNRLVMLQARGTDAVTDALSLSGTLYLRYANLKIENGSASGFAQCGQQVCDDSGPVQLLTGGFLPTNLPSAGIIPVQTTQELGLGGSAQATLDRPIGDMKNVGNFGVSFDQGSTQFRSITLVGPLEFVNPPGVLADSDGLALGGDDYNVSLDAVNRYYGVFLTDTLSVTDALSVTAAGRFNFAEVRLSDRFGDALNGNHYYNRVNPSIGATYQIDPAVNVYASYSEANRIPTAAELSCADPNQPCQFPLGFIADPNLSQVVARTFEVGARGQLNQNDLHLNWSADVYSTRNQNDIIFVSDGPLIGSGYFENAGSTERQGGEIAVNGSWQKFDFLANYGYVRATFRSNLLVLSDSNPASDVNGNIFVQKGARLPEVPQHTAKLGIGYSFPYDIHLGLDTVLVSSQYLRGDEANLQKPLEAYGVLNARLDWQATDRLSFFFEGENILDHRYDTFGLYADPTGNGAFPNYTNPRFYVPGQPFGFWLGAKVRF
jgi:outer membrane receptor protein involved in Fe transport